MHLQCRPAWSWLQVISAFVLGLLPGIGPSAGCALWYRARLAGTHARSAWRGIGGAAVLCNPSTNVASACKGPLCQYSIPRGDRCPNQDSRIFRGLSYVKIRVFTLGEPTRGPNSRIYEAGSLYRKVRKVRGYANPCSMGPGWHLGPVLGRAAVPLRIYCINRAVSGPVLGARAASIALCKPPGFGACTCFGRVRAASNALRKLHGFGACFWGRGLQIQTAQFRGQHLLKSCRTECNQPSQCDL